MKTKLALSLAAAAACVAALAEPLTCASPDGKNALTFALGEKGEPTYSFAYRGKKVVEPSTLGFDIKALGKDAFDGRKPGELRTGFVLAGVERAKADETWRPVWGEESEIRDRHEEMLVKLVQKGTGRRMDLRFRVFDDGMGFRYEFPADDDNSVARLVPGENIAPEGKTQPLTHFTIVEKRTVSSSDALRLRAAPGGGAAVSFKPVQSLESLFDDPPQRRGANAWWHWQGANVTKYGITRDLEAMKDAGLSGATIFNIQDVGWSCEERMSTPLCPGMEYMSAKWWEMVKFAVAEAKRLGLELGIHNCPGYSTSGGPWITPELGMKKLVWAKGDAQPEAKLGFYRDIAKVAAKDGVYRFGYTCTGKNTHPSPPEVEAGSLEADKMSERAVALHVDHLLSELAAHGVAASNPGLAFILMDSYEAEDSSWTDDFAEEFAKRRGYDPVPFLPVLAKLETGFTPEREEQFRRDFARTKNELQTERHYRVFKERTVVCGWSATPAGKGDSSGKGIQNSYI